MGIFLIFHEKQLISPYFFNLESYLYLYLYLYLINEEIMSQPRHIVLTSSAMCVAWRPVEAHLMPGNFLGKKDKKPSVSHLQVNGIKNPHLLVNGLNPLLPVLIPLFVQVQLLVESQVISFTLCPSYPSMFLIYIKVFLETRCLICLYLFPSEIIPRINYSLGEDIFPYFLFTSFFENFKPPV